MIDEAMQSAFESWFEGYGNIEEPSARDGFKAGWEAAARATEAIRTALQSNEVQS